MNALPQFRIEPIHRFRVAPQRSEDSLGENAVAFLVQVHPIV